jgi:hypothetical protein
VSSVIITDIDVIRRVAVSAPGGVPLDPGSHWTAGELPESYPSGL